MSLLKNVRAYGVLVVLYSMCALSMVMHAGESIAPGVMYNHLIMHDPQQSIHILEVDPCQATITMGLAHGKCPASQTTSKIAYEHGAIAAVNGGFFDFGAPTEFHSLMIQLLDRVGYSNYNAFPVFTLKVHNRYAALSHPFAGIVVWNSLVQHPVFGALRSTITLTINEQVYPVAELNKPHQQEPTLYSCLYDDKSPVQRDKVTEVVIQENCIVALHYDSRGNTTIPKRGWVYVVPNQYKNLVASLQVGDPVAIDVVHEDKEGYALDVHQYTYTMDMMVGSTPLLIYKNEIVAYLKDFTSTFYTHRHPRTAIGLLEDGTWVFVVIDGRSKQSNGFTIMELAQFMKDLGCTSALNLDGGGSSTMVVQDRVVNVPCGREYALVRKERPVSNAFVITAQ